MTKAKRQMQEDIKLIDLVIELLDARVPLASRNPDIDELAKGKARLILLNKTDLADPAVTEEWNRYFSDKGIFVCLVDSRNSADMKQINSVVQKACAERIERDRKRGIKNRPVRAMVCGIPNVGKSTFINTYAKKAATKTGNKPGVTKGKQWIRLSSQLELLDTPGILWPKFEDQSVGLKLALIGSIRDEVMNTEELAVEMIRLLNIRYPGLVRDYYGLDDINADELLNAASELGLVPSDEEQMLYKIGKIKGALKQGGEVDTEKAAHLLLENYRNGRLGRLTLESPSEFVYK